MAQYEQLADTVKATDGVETIVNFKQPAQGHQTAYTHEVTIIVYMMGAEHIAATEKGEMFQATLDGALNAVEYLLHRPLFPDPRPEETACQAVSQMVDHDYESI